MSRARFYVVMVVLLLVEILSSLEHSMIITAMPTIAREFHGVGSLGWLLTGFLLAQAMTAAVGARLGDIFGRRRLLMIIVTLCAIGSAISAFTDSLPMIVLGRVVQGASGAILPLCYGVIRVNAPEGQAPLWIGVFTGAYAAAAAISYVLGGALAEHGSWRAIFTFTLVYAAPLIPLLLLVPEVRSTAPRPRIDVWGAVLFAPAIAAVLYGITSGAKAGWSSPQSWGFALAGLALLAVWTRHELRQADPLIDVRLLARKEVAFGNVCGALTTLGMMQLPLIAMLLLQQPRAAGIGLGVGATVAGFLKLPSNAASLLGAPFSGHLSGKHGGRLAIMLGSLVGAAAWTFLFFFHDTVWQVVIGTVVCAFGSAMLLAAVPIMVLEGTPLERTSEVTGLTSVIRSVFSAIGAQLITLMLASSQVHSPGAAPMPSDQAYRLAFGAVAASAAAVALLCALTRLRSPRVGRPRAGARSHLDVPLSPAADGER